MFPVSNHEVLRGFDYCMDSGLAVVVVRHTAVHPDEDHDGRKDVAEKSVG